MIIEKDAADFIDDGLLEYSSYIATSRALVSVADGLKPIQRKILYAMWKMKATNFTKSANVSGEVFKYSAHGDSYMSLVNMAQKDGNLIPLVTGKGSFGNRTSRDITPASSRYTESKLSPLAIEVMKNISQGGVEMVDNYDGSRKMPKYLAFDFPFALLAANQGIAFGLSSLTFSYNLRDICMITREFIQNKPLTQIVPDFSTGGEIGDAGKFQEIMDAGVGQITLYATCSIDKQTIVITEIPYYTTREQLIESILKKVRDKTLPEIKNVLDLSGLKGMRIEIELKKGVNADDYLKKLFSMGLLSTKTTTGMTMLNLDNKPELMSVGRVVEQWTTWKRGSIKGELEFKRKEVEKKLYTLSAIEAMMNLPLEEFIETMRFTPGPQILSTIMNKYALDEVQAKYVATLPMSALNADILQVKLSEAATYRQEIANVDAVLSDAKKIDEIILQRLDAAEKKYGQERLTKIVPERLGSGRA
ncbi:MAG: DNA gyrase subunit A, partial [Phocaeicola sp.]